MGLRLVLIIVRIPLSDIKKEIKTIFGAQVTFHVERYVGIPPIVGRNKRHVFSEIKEKVLRKIKGWKEKLLSQAGHKILIQVVAQSIPNNVMRCFLLPKELCEELNGIMRNFWRGQRVGECKIHLDELEQVVSCEMQGGMGFRDLYMFNLALLAKHG